MVSSSLCVSVALRTPDSRCNQVLDVQSAKLSLSLSLCLPRSPCGRCTFYRPAQCALCANSNACYHELRVACAHAAHTSARRMLKVTHAVALQCGRRNSFLHNPYKPILATAERRARARPTQGAKMYRMCNVRNNLHPVRHLPIELHARTTFQRIVHLPCRFAVPSSVALS